MTELEAHAVFVLIPAMISRTWSQESQRFELQRESTRPELQFASLFNLYTQDMTCVLFDLPIKSAMRDQDVISASHYIERLK